MKKTITKPLWTKLRNSLSKPDKNGLHCLKEIVEMGREKGIDINDIRYEHPQTHQKESLIEMVIWHNPDLPEDYKIKCIEFLVSQGMSVNEKSGYHGGTSLHYAAGGGNVKVIKKLLALGAHINEPDIEEGWTPLHWAASSDLEACKALVEAGADANRQNNVGDFPEDCADEEEISSYLKQVRVMLLERETLTKTVKPLTVKSGPKKRI